MKRFKKALSLFLAVIIAMLSTIQVVNAATPPDEDLNANLAKNKTVIMSPQMAQKDPGAASRLQTVTDGILTYQWTNAFYYRQGSEAHDINEKAWIQIDLGAEYDLDKIKYFGIVPPTSGYTHTSHKMVFQVSNAPNFDDASTKTVFNTDSENFWGFGAGKDIEQPNVQGGRLIKFNPVKARYVRYYQHGLSQEPTPGHNYAPNGLVACEIEVYRFTGKTITLDYNDGTGKREQLGVDTGNKLLRPQNPIHPQLDKRFVKWTVDTVGGNEWNFNDPVTANITLVANWEDATIRTVTFDRNGGSTVETLQVTDGLTIARPENPTKEGYVFAGWRLNNNPFSFNSAVTGDITLTAYWVSLPEENAVVLQAAMLEIVMDSHGKITNLFSTLDGKDYSTAMPDNRQRTLVSLIAENKFVEPTNVSYDETTGNLTFDFASINVQTVVSQRDEGDYLKLTLEEVNKPDNISVQAILWGPLKTSINDGAISTGTAYNKDFAIGMHMLNSKTVGGWPIEIKEQFYPSLLSGVRNGFQVDYSNSAAFNGWGSATNGYTWDYTQDTMRTVAFYSPTPMLVPSMLGKHMYTDYRVKENASMIGSSIGLYGTRPENILNVISNIELTEGLPHPTIDGEWQKTSIKSGQDFLVFNDGLWDANLSTIDNDIQMGLNSGIKMLYGQYGAGGPWTAEGTYEFNSLFGGSDANAKRMVERAAESGVSIGAHTLSNLIKPGAKYITPEATPALAFVGYAELTRDVSATDTEIYVSDGNPFSDKVRNHENRISSIEKRIRIGKEVLDYSGIVQVSDNEWKLTISGRGSYGTPKAAYSAGETAYQLWNYYNSPFVGGWESLEPMAERMGIVLGDVGLRALSTDSFESTKMTPYGSIMPGEFKTALYNELVKKGKMDGYMNESSNIDTNSWGLITRVSWGESNTPISVLNTSLNYYRKNFLPSMLGWIYDSGNHGGYGKANLLMNLSMKGGWEAGAGWYVNQNTFKSYNYMADWMKTWNNAIQHGAFTLGGEFTSVIQAAMRQAWTNNRIWTLTEAVPNQQWTLQEVNKTSLSPIGSPITLKATNNIHVVQSANGDIATSTSLNYSRAHSSDTVKIYTQANSGSQLDVATLKVKGEDNTEYPITANGTGTYTFQMPSQDVTITAQFPVTQNVVEIKAPASITGVPNGTAKTTTALGLPATVELVTDTTGSLNANVAWDVNASSYDASSPAGQTFTVNGTVTLPDGVVNPNNVALTTSINVTVLPVPVSASPQATLTNGQQVITGEALDVTMGLSNVSQNEFQHIYAQELTLTYDTVNMQFNTVTSLVYGLQVIDHQETVPGHVQLVLASTNPDGFLPQGDVLKFSFTAKAVTQVTNTTFGVSSFTIANGQGNELQINEASSSTQIILPAVPVDKASLNALITSAQAEHNAAVEGNMDGLYLTGSKAILQSAISTASATANNPNATQVQVDNAKAALAAAVQVFEDKKITADVNGNGIISIGDLAIVSSSYGKQSGQSGWNVNADVNKDGKVDITDLAIVAKAIIH